MHGDRVHVCDGGDVAVGPAAEVRGQHPREDLHAADKLRLPRRRGRTCLVGLPEIPIVGDTITRRVAARSPGRRLCPDTEQAVDIVGGELMPGWAV